VDKDSVILDPGHMGGGFAAQLPAQHMPAAMLPMQYMAPSMPGMSLYPRLDQGYTISRPAMWGATLPPQYSGRPMQMPSQAAHSAGAVYPGGPPSQFMQGGASMGGGMGQMDLQGDRVSRVDTQQLSAASSGYPGVQHQSQMPQQPLTAHAAGSQAFQPRSSSDASEALGDPNANLSPELQQLVRQLALSRLGPQQDSG
jgi:hypothetical protein